MNRLYEKLAILLICLTSLLYSGSTAASVIAFLTAFTVSVLAQVFPGKKLINILIVLCAASCTVIPQMMSMLPLLLYDALWQKKWYLLLPSLLVLIRNPDIRVSAVTAAGCACTVIMYTRVSKLEDAIGKLRSLRDEVTETNLSLKLANEAISRAQDSEIHIATLKERNRIAREIHDNVGHMLTRSLLQSGALIVINKDEDLKKPLEDLRDTLDTAMTSIRQSVHDLHDDSIDLRRALEDTISAVDGRFSVKLDYDISDNATGNVKLCILGVVKEGLSNAVKHSSGDKISISVHEHPGLYQLIIEDNGSCSKIADTGIGLNNMRERASSVGGTISFTPSEKGFRIFMSIPRKR